MFCYTSAMLLCLHCSYDLLVSHHIILLCSQPAYYCYGCVLLLFETACASVLALYMRNMLVKFLSLHFNVVKNKIKISTCKIGAKIDHNLISLTCTVPISNTVLLLFLIIVATFRAMEAFFYCF